MERKKAVSICGNDISKYAIVLPENETPTELTAAEELRSHILEAAGVSLPVARGTEEYGILIGNAVSFDRSGIKYDGYVIATDDKNLYLYGAIDRGTLYAVYRFLEKHIGFRKYEPGVGRLLPGDVSVPAGLWDASNPVFEWRTTNWASHTRDMAFAAWEAINPAEFPEVERYGGAPKSIGFCHTMESLCDPKLYFNEHPEYYSLYDGVRIPAGNYFDRPCGQLCLTNPDVLKIVIENVKRKLAENPGARIVEVSQNDNDRYCHCEKCAAVDAEEGSPSGLMLRFVNAVADAVAEEYPDVLIRTFAYQYTRKPPKLTRPRKNVIIRYCTIEACFRHPLADGACERNAGRFAAELAEWSKICDKMSVWDYTRNFSCYLAPFPNFKVLRENARLFAENKVLHLFEQDTEDRSYTGDLGSLKAYLLARLMWNPYMSEQEYQAHIDDFLEGYYGPGWKNIREYMRLLHDSTRDRHIGCFERMDRGFLGSDPLSEKYEPAAYQAIAEDSYLSEFIENHIDEAKRLWSGAEAMASNEAERERVHRSGLSVAYLDLFCRKYERDKMSAAEREAYEAAVARYHADKKRYDFRTNIWTNRAGH
jgi:hypothetical protein